MAVSIDDVTCLHATENAILVEIAGEHYWIPQSQVDADSEVYQRGDVGTLVITDWIAAQKGLG